MENFNILFTSSGRRVSLIRHFQQTLYSLGITGKIVTVDMRKNVPTAYISDYHEITPPVSDESFIHRIMEICSKYEIRLIIPLIDTDLAILAKYKSEFEKVGVIILVSSPEVIDISGDKRKTYRFFQDIGVDTPNVYTLQELLTESNLKFPYIIKPANGSSSVGVTIVNNVRELIFFNDYINDSIIQDYVEGEEFTIDVLVDFEGRVLSVVPRKRIETRAGEVSKGITVKNQSIIQVTKKVVEALKGAAGCITVQCILTESGVIKFIEINPRFGGGFPLSIKAGADFPNWIIKMLLKEKVDIMIDEWQEGIAMLRFDEAIFVVADALKW